LLWSFLSIMDGDLAIEFVANILYHPNCLVLLSLLQIFKHL
jgi:hypothetical protein